MSTNTGGGDDDHRRRKTAAAAGGRDAKIEKRFATLPFVSTSRDMIAASNFPARAGGHFGFTDRWGRHTIPLREGL
jgi:hypothetical protein